MCGLQLSSVTLILYGSPLTIVIIKKKKNNRNSDALRRHLLFFHLFSLSSLRDGAQVEQLLHYIVEEPSEDAESKRTFKYVTPNPLGFVFSWIEAWSQFYQFGHLYLFPTHSQPSCPHMHVCIYISWLHLFSWFRFPFMACEIFTCEIDVILKTLVEDEEVHDPLHSASCIIF